MVSSAYLESQKLNIVTNIVIANGGGKGSLDSNESNNIDSLISIFGGNIRNEIRAKAESCNQTSSSILLKDNNDQGNAVNSCNDVNGKVFELQQLRSWAGAATQEIAATPGIPDATINTLGQTMDTTLQFASDAIGNAVATANESLSRIQLAQDAHNNQDGQPNPSSDETKKVLDATKNNLDQVADNVKQPDGQPGEPPVVEEGGSAGGTDSTGNTGSTGTDNSKGSTGSTGSTGGTGSTGSTGDTGSKGTVSTPSTVSTVSTPVSTPASTSTNTGTKLNTTV